jgi:hypothetical protein
MKVMGGLAAKTRNKPGDLFTLIDWGWNAIDTGYASEGRLGTVPCGVMGYWR